MTSFRKNKLTVLKSPANKFINFWLGYIFIFISSTNFLSAQDLAVQKRLDSLIQEHSYNIVLNHNEISGQGAHWLTNEAQKANYFLIGERHGTANIPKISGAIFSKLVSVGYKHAALEIGRYAAFEVQELIQSGDYNSLQSFLETPEYFQSIAFLDWAEESMLVARITKESPLKEKAIWGLDQEFIFGFRMYLERLKKIATKDSQKQLISILIARLSEDPFLLGGPIKTELNTLITLFEGNFYAIDLLESLLISNKIYSRFRGDITRIQSNTIRENLMKKNLVDLVNINENDYGNNPKIFFKLGGFHSAPSLNNGYSTLGTFVEEWALSRSESAFNIYIDAVSGNTLASGQDNPNGGSGIHQVISQFGNIDVDNTDITKRHIFFKYLKNNVGLFLVDLRPLRALIDDFEPFIDLQTKSLIIGFDAYLAIPNVSPATPFDLNK